MPMIALQEKLSPKLMVLYTNKPFIHNNTVRIKSWWKVWLKSCCEGAMMGIGCEKERRKRSTLQCCLLSSYRLFHFDLLSECWLYLDEVYDTSNFFNSPFSQQRAIHKLFFMTLNTLHTFTVASWQSCIKILFII